MLRLPTESIGFWIAGGQEEGAALEMAPVRRARPCRAAKSRKSVDIPFAGLPEYNDYTQSSGDLLVELVKNAPL